MGYALSQWNPVGQRVHAEDLALENYQRGLRREPPLSADNLAGYLAGGVTASYQRGLEDRGVLERLQGEGVRDLLEHSLLSW